MAFKFDDRGFLLTRNIVDEPKNSPIVQNNIVIKEEPKPIIIKEKSSKKPIHLKSPNVIPYTRQTSNEEPQQPTGLLNKYRQYQLKKIEKKQLASDIDLLQENEKQTKLLEEIAKKGSSENNSKGWLSALLGGLLTSSVAKIIKPLTGIMALLSGMKLLGGLGGKAKGGIASSSKNKKAKVKGGVLGKGLKGIAKKAGAIGMVISGIEGISDYKEWKGLSKEHNTTLREKITGTLGGIANGFNDFVEFASMGTVDLFEKDEAFEVIDNVTSNIKQASESMLSRFPTVQASINLFTDGVNGLLNKSADGFKNIYDLSKEAIRTKTKDEKEFVNANNARTLVQTELEDGQNFFEGNDEWNKRKNELEKKLYLLKEDEYKKAQIALENSDFRANSIHKGDAIEVVDKTNFKRVEDNNKKYEEWTIKKNDAQSKLEKTTSSKKEFQRQLKDKDLSEHDRKMLSLKIDSYAIAMNNLANELNEVMKKKPTVRKFEPYDLGGVSISTDTKALLDEISEGEGTTLKKAQSKGYNSEYDVTLGYGKYADDKSKPITQMTMREVYALQKKMKQHKDNKFKVKQKDGTVKYLPSSAVGKWQIVEGTLRKLQKKLGISDDEKFTPELQDRMAEELLNKRGYKKFKKGELSIDAFENNLAKEWASIARSDTKKSHYGQHVGTTYKEMQTVLSNRTALTPQRNESIIAKAQTIKANQSKPIIVKQPITNQPPLQSQEVVKNKQEIIEKVVNKPTAPTFPQRQPIVEPRIVLNLNQESLKESI